MQKDKKRKRSRSPGFKVKGEKGEYRTTTHAKDKQLAKY